MKHNKMSQTSFWSPPHMNVCGVFGLFLLEKSPFTVDTTGTFLCLKNTFVGKLFPVSLI